jgi:hypothetical protein
MKGNVAVVVTSIAGPNPALRESWPKIVGSKGGQSVIVGDEASPKDFRIDDKDFRLGGYELTGVP